MKEGNTKSKKFGTNAQLAGRNRADSDRMSGQSAENRTRPTALARVWPDFGGMNSVEDAGIELGPIQVIVNWPDCYSNKRGCS